MAETRRKNDNGKVKECTGKLSTKDDKYNDEIYDNNIEQRCIILFVIYAIISHGYNSNQFFISSLYHFG